MSHTAGQPGTTGFGSIGSRIGAYFLDGLFSGLATLGGILLAVVFGFLIGLVSVEGGVLIFFVGYVLAGLGYAIFVWRMLAVKGYSPGKKILKLRLLDADTMKPIGWWRVWLRGFVLSLITFLTLGIGAIVVAMLASKHPRRQGWHDLAVGSVVVTDAATSEYHQLAAAELAKKPPLSASAPPEPPKPAPPLAPTGPPRPPSPQAMGAPPRALTPPPPGAPKSVPPVSGPAAGVVVPPPPAVAPLPPAPSPTADIEPAAVAVEPAAVAVEPPAVTAELDDEASVDERTRPPRPKDSPWLLRDATETQTLGGPVLVGRDPDASLVDGATVWSLDDPERTVSKTHALFGLEEGAPFVEDWSSTNGVTLSRGGTRTVLAVHERTSLQVGDEVALGEYVVRLEGGA